MRDYDRQEKRCGEDILSRPIHNMDFLPFVNASVSPNASVFYIVYAILAP